MSRVRLLPALIAVSIGALAFKGVDIYQAVAQAVDAEVDTGPKPETALTAGVGDHAEPAPPAAGGITPVAAPNAATCLPSLDYAAELGVTSQEILVLRSLSDRRKQLDDREANVETREQAAAAAEQRLQDQIGDLKKVESQVQALLTSMDAKRDERMTALVKTYEAMKPKDAARIFDGMEDQILIDLAKSMKPANLASVMSLMQPKRAEALTRMLADLVKPPAGLDGLPKTPT